MSDLYRVGDLDVDGYDTAYRGPGDVYQFRVAEERLEALIDDGVLVKVEPCEHGNYAGHPVEHTIRIVYSTVDGRVEYTKMDYTLCDGKPEASDV